MTSPESMGSESIRKPIAEGDPELWRDLRRYEVFRDEKDRDEHIEYARSACRLIQSGVPLDWVVQRLLEDIPAHGKDVNLYITVQNALFEQSELPVRIDSELSLYLNGEKVVDSSSYADELKTRMKAAKAARDDECRRVAEEMVVRVQNGMPLMYLLPIIKSDLVWYNMDNVRIAEIANQLLEADGSAIRFDRYLDPIPVAIEVTGEHLTSDATLIQ